MTEPTQVEPVSARQVLSFASGGSDYGIPILKVREILQYEGVTEVPSAPQFVRGVTNVRGAVVPVVDLAVKLGRSRSAPTTRSCVLVVDVDGPGERRTVGIFADAVSEVVDLGATDIEPPPALGAGVRVPYLTGLGKVGRGFVLLLDVDAAINSSDLELAVDAAAASPSRASSSSAPAAPFVRRGAIGSPPWRPAVT